MNKKALICFIIIGSVLLTTIVSLSYNLNAQKKQNQDMLELAELDKKELEDQYQEFANQYGDMKDMITDKEISSQLGIQQTKAQQILKKIKVTDPHNAQELARLKKQLPSFKNVLKAYMNQLDSLRKTNSNLIAENARVKEQFDEATNHITGLNTQNRDLSYKVAIASQLNVDDVNLLFKNKRGKTTKKPKKAKTIEITFNIAKNPTAPKGNKNMIELRDKKKILPMNASSSGLQSAIPMLMIIDYALRSANYDAFVIEEPEQNLFPENQREVLNFIASRLAGGSDRQCVITTHSPYMLSCLNVLMLASKLDVEESVKAEVEKIVPPSSMVNPDSVAAYSLDPNDEDGIYCKSLISEKTGMVSVNALDTASLFIGEDFDRLARLYSKVLKSKK